MLMTTTKPFEKISNPPHSELHCWENEPGSELSQNRFDTLIQGPS
jgi:hypothetical protein